MTSESETIAAIIVTFNRPRELADCVQSLEAQTRRPDEIVVVDNAANPATKLRASGSTGVTYLAMPENLGPAGGFAAGIDYAIRSNHDWVWLFNDDGTAEPTALESLLADILHIPRPPGIVGYLPANYWRGRTIPVRESDMDGQLTSVDMVTFHGSLVSSKTVRQIGLPNSDYFMQFEEWEYCLRARKAGISVLASPLPLVKHAAAGSTVANSGWRGYYQTRNHLRMVLDSRSPMGTFWWLVRQIRLATAILRRGPHRRDRLRLRALGGWHGLLGVQGRFVDPITYRNRRLAADVIANRETD